MSVMIGKFVRGGNRTSHQLIRSAKSPFSVTAQRPNYFFLLPEIPVDTAETNALMRSEQIPDYKEITSKKLQTGFQKLAVSYDAELSQLFQTLEDKENNTNEQEEGEEASSSSPAEPPTFESVFDSIEKSLAPLDHAYKTARHLSFIYPYSNYHVGFAKIDRKMQRTKNERWQDNAHYRALKQIESERHLLDESGSKARLLDRAVKNCTQNGLHLSEANFKVCSDLNNKIQEQQSLFKHRLNYANKKFGLRISNEMPMEDVPRPIKSLIAPDRSQPDKGPWTVYPNNSVFEGLMRYSGNRQLRQALFNSFYSRASYEKEQFQTNNSEIIKELVRYRHEQALLFGHKNFADMVIEDKAAVSVENVADMFDKIRVNVKPVVDEDLARLQKFAATHGTLTPLETFDIEYWKERHTSQYFKYDKEAVAKYFPFERVLAGLFDISKQLFGVRFEMDESAESRQKMWSSDVMVYKCLDEESGEHLSTLIVDPFIRSNKIDSIWSYSGRDSSKVYGAKPLAYLNLNVRNNEDEASTLQFDQVKSLFSEFGRAVQILLAETDYTELADLNLGESDASNLTNKLFEKLVYVPEMIEKVSGHVQTGEKLPEVILDQLENADQNLRSFKLMKQTFLSAFDIETHISQPDKFWTDVQEDLWKKFMPVKQSPHDFRPCQFTTIFGESFGCSYYSLLWSEMLSVDLFEAFNDVGFGNARRVKEVGHKYRETFLRNGSGVHANELFRQFRGRNPSMDPFIRSYLPSTSSSSSSTTSTETPKLK